MSDVHNQNRNHQGKPNMQATASPPLPRVDSPPTQPAQGHQIEAAAAVLPAAEKREVVRPPLPESRWSLREHKDPGHWVCLERGTPYEQVFEPLFWASIAGKARFQPGQTVRVINDELTVFAELVILECGRNWAIMGEFTKKTRDQLVAGRPPAKQAIATRIEYAGPIDRWRVIRLSDQAVIKAGLDSEATAFAYNTDYLRRVSQ